MDAKGKTQTDEVINLLADGEYVWRVAEITGVDKTTVSAIKERYAGRIIGIRRERAGQRVDGSPKAEPEKMRLICIHKGRAHLAAGKEAARMMGGSKWTVYTPGRNAALPPGCETIRTAWGGEWTDADVRALIGRLNGMSCRELDELADRIAGRR